MSINNIFKEFPGTDELINWFNENGSDKTLLVNCHFHTPYSFSAFSEMEQIFKMAADEGISVLGISDFTAEGYSEFCELAKGYRIFPLFNIEFMVLQKEEQDNQIRVNDPNNPGRTYFTGKALSYPVQLNLPYQKILESVLRESNIQIAEMIDKLNVFLSEFGSDIQFDFDEIKAHYAKNLLRERHIARALRIAVDEKYNLIKEKMEFYTLLFSGRPVKSSLKDEVSLENEIRENLLKAGGRAFVPENSRAFLSLKKAKDIIANAGGLPCYPVMLDNAKGEFTEYEEDKELLCQKLISNKVFCIEFITGENDFSILKSYVKYFHEKKFVITFGTEHNTAQLNPIKVFCRNGIELDEELKKISYEGACVLAAHQYLIAKGEKGFQDENGYTLKDEMSRFILLGKAAIQYFINT